jgi:hypothetical protein
VLIADTVSAPRLGSGNASGCFLYYARCCAYPLCTGALCNCQSYIGRGVDLEDTTMSTLRVKLSIVVAMSDL